MAQQNNRRAVIKEIAIKLERFTKKELAAECWRNGLYDPKFLATVLDKAIEEDVVEHIQKMTVEGAPKVRLFPSVQGKRGMETVDEFVWRPKMTHDDWISEHLSAKTLLVRIKNRANNTVKYARQMLGLKGRKQKALPASSMQQEIIDKQLTLFEIIERTRSDG